MAREATFKPTTYLRVNGDGQLYTGSSEPKEGYVEFVSKQGNVSYRKIFSGTEYGKITQLGIEEKVYDTGKVKYVVIAVENENAKDIIQLQLKNQTGTQLSDIVRKFIAILPGIDFKRDLTISSNRKKNERGYVDRVLFVNYVNDGVQEEQGIKFSLKFGKDGNVPQFTVTEGIDGLVYDFTEQDKFLYGVLLEQLERFQKERSSVRKDPQTETTTEPNVKEAVKEKAQVQPQLVIDDEGDELPF